MALFNAKTRKRKKARKVINRAGGQAYKQSAKLALASTLLTSFAQNQYYRRPQDIFKEMAANIIEADPLFAAKAAVFARNEFGMRSITHVLAAELAAYASGEAWAKHFYNKVIRRPDDMLEIAAYYKGIGGGNLTNGMKKGFAKAFNKFDAYQLAKYRGDRKAVKLVDIVNMVRPIPTAKNAEALKQLIAGDLKNTETWEAQLTEAGHAYNKSTAKAQVWANLLKEGKLGYFALIRNLRNILGQAPNMIDEVCRQLVDPKRIKNSLVLPFRLLVAYKQLNGHDRATRKVKNALENAIDIACNNVPDLPNTLVVVDNSGSMGCNVSNSKHTKCNEMGALFGMIVAKRSGADLMEFGTTARYITYRRRDSVMRFSANFAQNNQVGHGTNFHSIFNTAKRKYDRIIIFSDMQGWIGGYMPTDALKNYKYRTDSNPFIYSFDLAGYGDMQFLENKVCALAGFSDKVFDMMSAVETDPKVLIKTIEAVEL